MQIFFENCAGAIRFVRCFFLPNQKLRTSTSVGLFLHFFGPGHLLQKVGHHDLLRLSCIAVPSEAPPGTWMCLVRCALWILDIFVLQQYMETFSSCIKDCLPYLFVLACHQRSKQRVHQLNAYLSEKPWSNSSLTKLNQGDQQPLLCPRSCIYVLRNIEALG